MAGWKIEATKTQPALLEATDLQGKRRSLNRVDGLHYLCHEDFMACLTDAYKKVDVLGKVHQRRITGITFGSRGILIWRGNNQEKGARTNLIRVPKELEDLVLPTDPTNIDRTRIALSKPNGKTGELFKKTAFLIEIYAKQQNSRFARFGIASTRVAIQMGAKTGRGTGFDVQHQYVLKKTLEEDKKELLEAVHALAKTHVGQISYTSVVVTKLKAGQGLNCHVDNKNHGHIPNHTICFGDFEGGHLEVERPNKKGDKEWQLVGVDRMWISFYARSMMHGVSEVKQGVRYSVTFYTPGTLDMVPEGDWDCLRSGSEALDFLSTKCVQGCSFFVWSSCQERRPRVAMWISPIQLPRPRKSQFHSGLQFRVSRCRRRTATVQRKYFLLWIHMCGESRGSTCCSNCGKLACSQHIRVKVDQQQQKALPVCRSCPLMDESSRHSGLEALPLNITELTDGIRSSRSFFGRRDNSSKCTC
eukprot:1959167-Amphidinium_carterae.2